MSKDKRSEVWETAYQGVVDLFGEMHESGMATDELTPALLTGALQAVASATFALAPDIEDAEMLIQCALDAVRNEERGMLQ